MKARLLALAACFLPSLALADNWPHWMGPKRDNVWYETGILEKFPQDGPKKLWSFPVAGGYSGPSVVDGKVYITDYVKQKGETDEGNFERKPTSGLERVFCVDAKTGKEVWKYEYPVNYTISYPAGPRCTPVVDGGFVYTLGSEGHLACLNIADGKKVWAKELKDEYKTKSALWGYAAHPLIDGDKIITLAGGEGSHVVALNKKTGAEIWKSQSQEEQGYVPPSIIEVGGKRQLLIGGPKALRALNPDTGERIWTTPYEARNGSIIMTPIRIGDYLFIGGYDTKNLLLKLDATKPEVEVLWKDNPTLGMHPVNVQPFAIDNIIYGMDGGGEMMAFEVPSGKRLWTSQAILADGKKLGTGTAFLVKNGDRFICFNELGEIVICKLDAKSYTEIDRKKVLEPTDTAFGRKVVWSMPAYADKKMFLRNGKEMICIDMAK
jgi:outer membrane protein assembly factor BamB